jgi:hypothetical protein
MDYLPTYEFRQCVERYAGNYKVKSFSCWDQFLSMAFAQLTYRESLRDIQACLRAAKQKTYHMGIRGKISRNTLAHANQTRDWRIYADFAQVLIGKARQLYAKDSFGVVLKQTTYALDATTIDLCLSLFPWATFRKNKGAVKLHTLLDLKGNIPTIAFITSGSVHEVNILDKLPVEAGAIYIMDRGYLDYARLYKIHQSAAYFVTRAKSNARYDRCYYRKINRTTGLRSDQIVTLHGYYARKDYPERLRRIAYYDETQDKSLVFLTNNFKLPALTITEIYRKRWQIELFFKWIKQHLRIKAFYGTSENTVKTQIWIAISVYVLVAIIKKELNLEQSLYTILQIISVTLFEKIPLLQALTDAEIMEENTETNNQLNLFN